MSKFYFCLLFFLLCCASIASSSPIPHFRISNVDLQNLVNRMRQKDHGKAAPGQIRLNYQQHTSTRTATDDARRDLFVHVDRRLLNQDTYMKFQALLNNYDRDTGHREFESRTEREEINSFLDAILRTEVMNELRNFLHQKAHPYAGSERVFKNWLRQLWFDMYSRARGAVDTCGFEHVFVGEVKNGAVSGMHNWIRYYMLEKSARGDYKGFLVKRGNIMAAVKFGWERELKRSGSFLIGTSPEFEFALNTLCFLTHNRGREDLCRVYIDGCELSITSHVISQRGKDFIGSIFPSAGRITDTCRRSMRSNQ